MTPVATKKTGQLTILCEKGDDQIIWDMDDAAQTSDAEKAFDKFKKDGCQLFRVKKGKQTPITKFDPTAEEILVIKTLKRG